MSSAGTARRDLASLKQVTDKDELVDYTIERFRNRECYHPLGAQALLAFNPGNIGDVGGNLTATETPKDEGTLSTTLQHFWGNQSLTQSTREQSIVHQSNRAPLRQTIIALGESGSGKSTIIKKCIKLSFELGLLRQRGRTPQDEGHLSNATEPTSETKERSDLEAKLETRLELVELWGNAKTKNNPDSSRMGKLIQIFRSSETNQLDCSIRPLMIEDTRLKQLRDPLAEEKTFHIFYVFASSNHEVFKQFPELLNGIHQSLPDSDRFSEIEQILQDVGQEASTVWDGLAAVWLLATARSFSDPKVDAAVKLLAIDAEFDLLEDLKVNMSKNLYTEEQELFVWAKTIYRRLFLRIIPLPSAQTARALATTDVLSFIDICGFETLQENHLQQLLINDCNDRIQEQFEKLALAQAPGNQLPKPSTATQGVQRPTSKKAQLLNLVSTSGSLAGLNRNLRTFQGSRSEVEAHPTKGLQVQHVCGWVRYEPGLFVEDKEDGVRNTRMNASPIMRDHSALIPKSTTRNVITAYLRDQDTITKSLTKVKVLFIRCVKAHRDLEAWAINRDLVIAQMDSLAIWSTVQFVRDLPGGCCDLMFDFMARYDTVECMQNMLTDSNSKQIPPFIYYSENLRTALERELQAQRDKQEKLDAERLRIQALEVERHEAEILAEKIALEEAKRSAEAPEAELRLQLPRQAPQLEPIHFAIDAAEDHAASKVIVVGSSDAAISSINPIIRAPDESLATSCVAASGSQARSHPPTGILIRAKQHPQPITRTLEDTDHEAKPLAPLRVHPDLRSKEMKMAQSLSLVNPLEQDKLALTPLPQVRHGSRLGSRGHTGANRLLARNALDSAFLLESDLSTGFLKIASGVRQLLCSWIETVDQLQKFTIETDISDMILTEVEIKVYQSGLAAGKEVSAHINWFLERSALEAWRNNELFGSDRSAIVMFICRIFRALQSHYAMLATVSLLPDGPQRLRADGFKIDISEAVQEAMQGKASQFWITLAGCAEAIVDELFQIFVKSNRT